jgi:phosphohistidine phosphatase
MVRARRKRAAGADRSIAAAYCRLANPNRRAQSWPMRRLFLIRHAKAEPSVGQVDYERALTDRGRDDARRVASALAARDALPQTLIHSGALRTKQTAEIFAAQWPRRVALEEQLGLYDATQGMLFSRARALPDQTESVAFVGHNPGLGELATTLAGYGAYPELRRMALKFPTCAVAVIDFEIEAWDDLDRKSGLLALYLTPAELETETG